MSDVTDAPRTAAANDQLSATDQGGFIWYELITPDPAASKRFYDAVLCWNIYTETLCTDQS